MGKLILDVFPGKPGERIYRVETDQPLQWRPTIEETQLGPNTILDEGIYIVTVSENTPARWFELCWKASIAAKGQHPGETFVPNAHYDSSVAVQSGHIVGAALARVRSRTQFYWQPALKDDGTAYSDEELSGNVESNCPRLQSGSTLKSLRPTVWTMWVHERHRRSGIGRQLLSAIARHFNLGIDEIGYRLPLSAEAVRMFQGMRLNKIVCGF